MFIKLNNLLFIFNFFIPGFTGDSELFLHNSCFPLNSISTLEGGLNNVKIKTLYRIASALDVNVEDILNCNSQAMLTFVKCKMCTIIALSGNKNFYKNTLLTYKICCGIINT